jgi:hypothetical protein
VGHAFDLQARFAEIKQLPTHFHESFSRNPIPNLLSAVNAQADHVPRQIIQPLAICVFRVHLLLTSALKFLLRDAANKWLRKC